MDQKVWSIKRWCFISTLMTTYTRLTEITNFTGFYRPQTQENLDYKKKIRLFPSSVVKT